MVFCSDYTCISIAWRQDSEKTISACAVCNSQITSIFRRQKAWNELYSVVLFTTFWLKVIAFFANITRFTQPKRLSLTMTYSRLRKQHSVFNFMRFPGVISYGPRASDASKIYYCFLASTVTDASLERSFGISSNILTTLVTRTGLFSRRKPEMIRAFRVTFEFAFTNFHCQHMS